MTNKMVESGVTAFAPPPSPIYRYEISTKAGKISILLEDQASKQQWCTDYLAKDAYLTSTNRIGNATAADYVVIFKEALDYLVATGELNAKKTRRELVAVNGGLQLAFSVKVKVRQSVCAAKFVFHLVPVSRVRILENKLQEVEGELATARTRFRQVEYAQVAFLEGELKDGRLVWKSTERSDFELADDGSAIRFLEAGWYVVSLIMFLVPQPAGAYVELLRNEDENDLSADIVPFNGGRQAGVCVGCGSWFDKNDNLSAVAIDFQRCAGAGLTITKIGN